MPLEQPRNRPVTMAREIFIFNRKADLLITQRALSKRVRPGVWNEEKGPQERKILITVDRFRPSWGGRHGLRRVHS